jgi:hypothetical protein
MKFLMLTVSLLIAFNAQADVVIEVKIPPQSIPCQQPKPIPIRNADGTYTLLPNNVSTLGLCYEMSGSIRKELWTDLPEKGGTFIKVVEAK